MGAFQKANEEVLKDIDWNNVTAEQKDAIKAKLIKDKGAEYVAKLEKGEVYTDGACPVDPFEKVMCENCQ